MSGVVGSVGGGDAVGEGQTIRRRVDLSERGGFVGVGRICRRGADLSERGGLFGGSRIVRRGRIILIILTTLIILTSLTISVGDSTLIHTFFDAAFGHEAVLHSLQQFTEHICRLMYEGDAEIGHLLIGHAQND